MLVGKRPKKHEIVKEFLDLEKYRKNLVFHKEYSLFYVYQEDKGFYTEWGDEEMESDIMNFTINNYPMMEVGKNYIADIVFIMQRLIVRKIDHEDYNYLAFEDWLLNLTTFALEPHDREKVVLYQLPCKWNETKMEMPTFRKYLSTTIVSKDNLEEQDKETTVLLQEMMGYFLIDSIAAHVSFFLVGGGSNGKSRITTLLERIFGKEFCSFNTIETITTNNWALLDLIGKKLNIANEDESKYVKTSMFKAIISGDTLSGERKYAVKRITFTPRTKFVFSTNSMPTFKGLDYALKRRVIIIPFYQQFKHGDNIIDINLQAKLEAELPGIIGWAVRGAKRLIENEFVFSKSKAVDGMKRDFENEISSAVCYFREELELGKDDDFIGMSKLFSDYQDWCLASGKKHVNNTNFKRDIEVNIEGIKFARQSDGTGNQRRGMVVRRKGTGIDTKALEEVNF